MFRTCSFIDMKSVEFVCQELMIQSELECSAKFMTSPWPHHPMEKRWPAACREVQIQNVNMCSYNFNCMLGGCEFFSFSSFLEYFWCIKPCQAHGQFVICGVASWNRIGDPTGGPYAAIAWGWGRSTRWAQSKVSTREMGCLGWLRPTLPTIFASFARLKLEQWWIRGDCQHLTQEETQPTGEVSWFMLPVLPLLNWALENGPFSKGLPRLLRKS